MKSAASARAVSRSPAKHKQSDYRPTDAEIAAVKAVLRQRSEQPSLPTIRSSEDTKLVYDHPDQAVASCLAAVAIGCGDTKLTNGIITQLDSATIRNGKTCERDLNFALAVVCGIEPKDTVEALLATQMAAVHNATMTAAANLAQAKFVEQQDSASMMLNKLGRTFAAQVEALKRHRSAGEQTIKVEHVTVNKGGQAIVGIVDRGRGASKIESQPHEPLGCDAAGTALHGDLEKNRQALPSPRSSRMEGVSVSRSKERRTNGKSERRVAARSAR